MVEARMKWKNFNTLGTYVVVSLFVVMEMTIEFVIALAIKRTKSK